MESRSTTMKITSAFALLSVIILTLCAVPANAQPYNRTFVSANGANGGSCGGTITTPCLTFVGALTNTKAGGEINCLTPGDFGTVTIGESVSIICDGVSNGGILTSTATTAAITINAGSGATVYLSGLDLNGFNTATNGVLVSSASQVYINHSTMRNFIGDGVFVNSDTNPTRVVIRDSIIVKNSLVGVSVAPTSGAVNGTVIINTLIDGNTDIGVMGTNAAGTAALALVGTTVTGSPTSVNLLDGATADFYGPSNVIGAVSGTTTSVPFR
jgi:hypothetical protein